MIPSGCHVTKIFTVLSLSWDSKNRYAFARPFHALSMRLEGGSDFIHGDSTVHAGKNDIIFVPKGYDYIQSAAGSEKLICVHFELDTDRRLEPSVFTPINSAIFRRYFGELYDAWIKKAPGHEYAIAALLYRILENIELQRAQLDMSSRDVKKLLAPVVQYINAHYTDSGLTVAGLAAMMNVSEAYFRRIFREELGVAPKEYIDTLRLDHACMLLQSGYCSVKETAIRCGIPNTKYFTTFMKKKRGVLPSDLMK